MTVRESVTPSERALAILCERIAADLLIEETAKNAALNDLTGENPSKLLQLKEILAKEE